MNKFHRRSQLEVKNNDRIIHKTNKKEDPPHRLKNNSINENTSIKFKSFNIKSHKNREKLHV